MCIRNRGGLAVLVAELAAEKLVVPVVAPIFLRAAGAWLVAIFKRNRGMENEQFKVLKVDGDVVLIEKLGDHNNPYVVSIKFFSSISDY